VAEILQVTPKTVKDWCRSGKIPGVKLGIMWRVTEDDLQLFIDRQKTGNFIKKE